jgi:homoserine kinase
MPPDARLRDIVVPGSISNLGPGLDTLSVAVRLHLRVRILDTSLAPGGFDARFVSEAPGADNRIERAFRLASERLGPAPHGLRVEVDSAIPMRAGLGSSGAATVAGLRLYEAMTSPRPVEYWLRLAAEIEGHPDNAAASLLGGLAASCQLDDGRTIAWSRAWPADLRIVVATPHAGLDTAVSRGVLPAQVSLADAVFNLQRVLLLGHALEQGRYDLLRAALQDRWHHHQRAPLVPGLTEALALDHPGLLGVFLSGAGPSVVALTADAEQDVAALLAALYDRLHLPCTIRTLAAEDRQLEAGARQLEAGASAPALRRP